MSLDAPGSEVARIKIRTFGLDHYLDTAVGAYGDDHHDRGELVRVACARTTDRLGTVIPVDRVTLIGDTPNDVKAAVSTGPCIIAVATGKCSPINLYTAGAPIAYGILTEIPDLPLAVTG